MNTIPRFVQPVEGLGDFAAGISILYGSPWQYALSRDSRQVVCLQYQPGTALAALPVQTLPAVGFPTAAGAPTVGYQPNCATLGQTITYCTSAELPDTLIGGLVGELLWVVTQSGLLLELDPPTLTLLATYDSNLLEFPLTPMRFIGSGNMGGAADRVLYLQGRPGELIAWNTVTKWVDDRIDTGMGKLSSTVFVPAGLMGLDVCACTNDRGQLGLFTYSPAAGWRQLVIFTVSQLVGVLGGVPYLAAGSTGNLTLAYLVTRWNGQAQLVAITLPAFPINFSPTLAPVVTDYGIDAAVVGMTGVPGQTRFKLAYKQPPGASFDRLPVAVPQLAAQAIGDQTDTTRRWFVPCIDGAIWYYSDEVF